MKRFSQTEFFILIKANNNVLLSAVEQAYDEFAFFVFAEYAVMKPIAYHNALVYIREELLSLSKVLEKKRINDFM
jgi:hypothetical protein